MNNNPDYVVDLASYNNSWYQPGPKWKIVLWMLCSALFLEHPWSVFSGLSCRLLRLFGARIGKGVLFKPQVKIKYPWFLTVGDHCWIGERVWIDNLAQVTIGSNVCISQGAMLLTGNHNFKLPAFDLMVKPIILADGVWIGAQSVVCPGVTCSSGAILAVGSVATKNLENGGIYQGNPAVLKKQRLAAI